MSYKTVIWLILLTASGFVNVAVLSKHDDKIRALEGRIQQLEKQSIGSK